MDCLKEQNVVNKISNKSSESFAFVRLLTQAKNATYLPSLPSSNLCNMHVMYTFTVRS